MEVLPTLFVFKKSKCRATLSFKSLSYSERLCLESFDPQARFMRSHFGNCQEFSPPHERHHLPRGQERVLGRPQIGERFPLLHYLPLLWRLNRRLKKLWNFLRIAKGPTIIVGDFNMVENLEDWWNKLGVIIGGLEN